VTSSPVTSPPRKRADREVLVIAHTGRAEIRKVAQQVIDQLEAAGIRPRVLSGEAEDLRLGDSHLVVADAAAADGVELVLVLGGDGSLLRGAEFARDAGAALLGINLGHVGFLAEAEPDAVETTVQHIVACDYSIERRMTIDISVVVDGEVVHRDWALNEISVEKCERARLLDCVLEVEGRPLSRWGCDGVLVSTPTGSTAYAFSAGGPVIWPGVEALLVVPISAHALFARPLVVAPSSLVAVEVMPSGAAAQISCDGRRVIPLPAGSRIEARRGERPVLLARTEPGGFTDRLVRKFGLPVGGWRGLRP
jgi:NAD+ kinase